MDLNHVAVFVDSLDDATLGPALSGWGPTIDISEQPVTVDGRPTTHSGRTRKVRTTAARIFGVSVEDSAPGAPIQPVPGHAWHHVAVWCSDLAGAVQALEEHGYVRDVVGRGPDGELATFAYMVSERGPRFELVDAAIREGWTQLYLAGAQAEGEGDGSPGIHGAPLVPQYVATVVESVQELESLSACLQRTLGIEWGEITESTRTVVTADGERELRAHSVMSAGSPCLSIVAPDPESRSLLPQVAGGGWHHVGFQSRDVMHDIAALERLGFSAEFRDPGEGGRPPGFAMLVAPEGTRIELVGV